MRVARTNVAKLLLDLRVCSSSRDLERGKRIHEAAGRIAGSIVAANALVAMYARCGSLDLARGVFDRMPCHNAGSWSSLVLGYVENGEEGLGVEIILSGMIAAPDSGIFLAGFKACAGLATKEMGCEIDGTLVKTQALEKAMALHSKFQRSSCGRDYILHNNMVSMYSKCGSLADARRVFDRMLLRDVVSWNSLVMGCAENEEEELALELFGCMGMGKNCEPDSRTLVAVLKACAILAAKEDGCHVDGKFVKLRCVEKVIALHDRAREMGCDREIYVASTLVDAYAKCGRMADSQQVFDSLTSHNVVSWTALIRGYVENGQGELALELFDRMKREGRTLPDALMLAAALKACATMAAREEGKQIDGRTVKMKWLEKGMVVHSQATRMVSNSVQVANTVIDMYCRCGSMLNARKVFDTLRFPTVVSWNALLLGYADNGEAELCLELFEEMRLLQCCDPNSRTFVPVLKACTCLAASEEGQRIDGKLVTVKVLERGMSLHVLARRSGWETDAFVESSLVNLYARCGSMVDARKVFDSMAACNPVLWTTLIVGYAESGEGQVALDLFAAVYVRTKPDAHTLAAALKSCSSLVAVEVGKALHAEVCRSGLENDAVLVNCLVDFYGKCGKLVDASCQFDSASMVDMLVWTALIAGYCRQGDTTRAFELFNGMQDQGSRPNAATFLCLLTLCSHVGLIEEGKRLFHLMQTSRYEVQAELGHYHCLVDILGRAGEIDKAVAVLEAMPFKPSALSWSIVLGACRKWNNTTVGKLAFEWCLKLEGSNAAAYSLMANIQGTCQKLETDRSSCYF